VYVAFVKKVEPNLIIEPKPKCVRC